MLPRPCSSSKFTVNGDKTECSFLLKCCLSLSLLPPLSPSCPPLPSPVWNLRQRLTRSPQVPVGAWHLCGGTWWWPQPPLGPAEAAYWGRVPGRCEWEVVSWALLRQPEGHLHLPGPGQCPVGPQRLQVGLNPVCQFCVPAMAPGSLATVLGPGPPSAEAHMDLECPPLPRSPGLTSPRGSARTVALCAVPSSQGTGAGRGESGTQAAPPLPVAQPATWRITTGPVRDEAGARGGGGAAQSGVLGVVAHPSVLHVPGPGSAAAAVAPLPADWGQAASGRELVLPCCSFGDGTRQGWRAGACSQPPAGALCPGCCVGRQVGGDKTEYNGCPGVHGQRVPAPREAGGAAAGEVSEWGPSTGGGRNNEGPVPPEAAPLPDLSPRSPPLSLDRRHDHSQDWVATRMRCVGAVTWCLPWSRSAFLCGLSCWENLGSLDGRRHPPCSVAGLFPLQPGHLQEQPGPSSWPSPSAATGHSDQHRLEPTMLHNPRRTGQNRGSERAVTCAGRSSPARPNSASALGLLTAQHAQKVPAPPGSSDVKMRLFQSGDPSAPAMKLPHTHGTSPVGTFPAPGHRHRVQVGGSASRGH